MQHPRVQSLPGVLPAAPGGATPPGWQRVGAPGAAHGGTPKFSRPVFAIPLRPPNLLATLTSPGECFLLGLFRDRSPFCVFYFILFFFPLPIRCFPLFQISCARPRAKHRNNPAPDSPEKRAARIATLSAVQPLTQSLCLPGQFCGVFFGGLGFSPRCFFPGSISSCRCRFCSHFGSGKAPSGSEFLPLPPRKGCPHCGMSVTPCSLRWGQLCSDLQRAGSGEVAVPGATGTGTQPGAPRPDPSPARQRFLAAFSPGSTSQGRVAGSGPGPGGVYLPWFICSGARRTLGTA